MKSAHIRSFSGPHFTAFPTSVQMQENTDQKNYKYGHFVRSVTLSRHEEVRLVKGFSQQWKSLF